MQANQEFLKQDKRFWSLIRSVSEKSGYTDRKTKTVKAHDEDSIFKALRDLNLNPDEVFSSSAPFTLKATLAYFQYRADILNEYVRPNLMDKDQAESLYNELYQRLSPTCPLPMNKQKKEKSGKAFFTCIINMLIEEALAGNSCDYDPRNLTTVTSNGIPLRTLARRVDGAYPATINPKAIWEIKEYYYTTTFGSRVAGGIYETLLDGMELEELHEHENVEVKHYLMVDDYFTWWGCGRSYLCRIIDMLHMGYIDEAFFGREVVERLPQVVKSWL
jgi:hypothetical protein